MEPRDSLVRQLQRLRVQTGGEQPEGNTSAALATVALSSKQVAVSVDSWPQKKVMALCMLSSPPDNGAWGALEGGSAPAAGAVPALQRLLCIPQHCTYAQLARLLIGGLAPSLATDSATAVAAGSASAFSVVRITYSQPSSPSVRVEVANDRGVSLMWEEAMGGRGGGAQLLHIYLELLLEGQGGGVPGQGQAQQQQQGQQQPQHEDVHRQPLIGATTDSTPTSVSAGLAVSSSTSSLASLPTASQHTETPHSPDLCSGDAPCLHVIHPSQIRLLTLLSSRSSILGHVYEGEWGGIRVAVRWLRWSLAGWRQTQDASSQRALLRSTAPLASLRHSNLVEVYGVVLSSPPRDEQAAQQPSPAYRHPPAASAAGTARDTGRGSLPRLQAPALVMEWVDGGSLRAALSKRGHPLLRSSSARLQLAADVAAGMAYLHSRGVVHFMLQPGCILLGEGPEGPGARVGGYELPSAKLSALMAPQVAFRPNVLPYLAPEVHKGNAPITDKADVYSFAMLLWELWAQKQPYDSVRFPILVDSMRGSGLLMRPIIPGKTSGVPQPVPGWRTLMERCWAEDPQQRPTFEEICHELKDMAAALHGQRQQ